MAGWSRASAAKAEIGSDRGSARGEEGLVPKGLAGMDGHRQAVRIGRGRDIGPNAQGDRDVRDHCGGGISEPGGPDVDVGNRAGLAARKIIGQDEALARSDARRRPRRQYIVAQWTYPATEHTWWHWCWANPPAPPSPPEPAANRWRAKRTRWR